MFSLTKRNFGSFSSILMLLVISLAACNSNSDHWQIERDAAKDKLVRENMRTAQKAAERYAADHRSTNYPLAIDEYFQTYFPGGTEGRQPAPVGPVNPFSGHNEFPVLEKRYKSLDEIRAGKRFVLEPGK